MKAGWEIKKLGDVCEVIAGQSPEGHFYNTEGKGMPFYQGKKAFGEKFIEAPTTWTTQITKVARDGDILMSVRAPVGPVNFATDEVCIGRGLASIRSGAELHSDFLFYQLLHLQPDIAGREGAVFASINKAEIETLPIAFVPLPEQQRIVGILDEAFEGIAATRANAERNLKNARAIFESELNEIFTKKGEGWEETKLGSVIDVLTGFAFKSQGYTSSDDGIPLLRGDNIVQGEFRWDNVKKWPKEDAKTYDKFLLEENDVVLAMDRTWVNAGIKYAQISSGDLPCLLLQRVARLRSRKRLKHSFLRHLLGSPVFARYVLSIQTGLGVPHISGKQIEDFEFYLPPLNSQIEIAEKLDVLDKDTRDLKTKYELKLTKLDSLKKSLLHHAFTGQL